jgi:ligand-binding sensor domain-containing protein
MARSGKGLGLQQFSQGVSKGYVVPGMDGTALDITALLIDRDNTLWIGTMKDGIYRVHDGKADHFRSADGLSSDSVENFYQDRERNLWVVTSKGIDCLRDLRVASFTVREGLTADRVNSVLAARDGTIWMGNEGAWNSCGMTASRQFPRATVCPGGMSRRCWKTTPVGCGWGGRWTDSIRSRILSPDFVARWRPSGNRGCDDRRYRSRCLGPSGGPTLGLDSH